VSAIPCLNYRKGLDKEREAAESQDGQPAALVETPMVTEEASTVTKEMSTATKETSTATNETQVVTVETPMAPTSDNVSDQTNGPADPNASTGWGSLFNILNALFFLPFPVPTATEPSNPGSQINCFANSPITAGHFNFVAFDAGQFRHQKEMIFESNATSTKRHLIERHWQKSPLYSTTSS
jgi:hypothetical protein